MTFSPFAVLLVPFPFADRLVEKVRPAVVISRPELEAAAGVAWLAMITSSERKDVLGDVRVTDIEAAGVRAPCRVRTTKIAALDPSRVFSKIGSLCTSDAERVMQEIIGHLAHGPSGHRS